MLTSHDGLFSKTTTAAQEQKKATIIEAVKTADMYLEIDNKMPDSENKDGKKDIESLITKLGEISEVKDDKKNYIIDKRPDEQAATIIDLKLKVVVDVTIENNRVIIESEVTDDIAKVVAPTIELTYDPKEPNTPVVTITIIAKEENMGIAKIQFPDNTEEPYSNKKRVEVQYPVSENGPYKFVVVGANGRRATETIKIDNVLAPNAISKIAKVGDYVNYDAGKWTAEDFKLIKNSIGKPTVNESKALPTTHKQFGGFTIGESRNRSSTQYKYTYTMTGTTTIATVENPRTEGWRVWDVDASTGIVTLISAGNPETYFHSYNASTNSGTESANVLKKRDCSMYIDRHYATEAKILTGQEAAQWYTKNFGGSWILNEPYDTDSTFNGKHLENREPVTVLDNGALFWFASEYSPQTLYSFFAVNRHVCGTILENSLRFAYPSYAKT